MIVVGAGLSDDVERRAIPQLAGDGLHVLVACDDDLRIRPRLGREDPHDVVSFEAWEPHAPVGLDQLPPYVVEAQRLARRRPVALVGRINVVPEAAPFAEREYHVFVRELIHDVVQ